MFSHINRRESIKALSLTLFDAACAAKLSLRASSSSDDCAQTKGAEAAPHSVSSSRKFSWMADKASCVAAAEGGGLSHAIKATRA